MASTRASGTFRCAAAVFLLAATLAMPLAAEPRVRTEREPGAVWGLLAEIWNQLTAVWEENGCSIDPYGGCGTTVPSVDAGCKIDPFGGCIPLAPNSDEGCKIDPYGRCQSLAPTSDNGCSIDPFGGCGSGS